MNKFIACFGIALVSLTMCRKNDTADFSLLNGNDFVFKVDRISLAPGVQFPHDTLVEKYYTPSVEDIQYDVTFTEDGSAVSIFPGPVSGEKSKDGKKSKFYDLDNGLAAGGRFIVWIDNGIFEGEFTKYGSGVPIIRSERGKLELKSK